METHQVHTEFLTRQAGDSISPELEFTAATIAAQLARGEVEESDLSVEERQLVEDYLAQYLSRVVQNQTEGDK